MRRLQVAYYRRDDPSRNIHSDKLVEASYAGVQGTLRNVIDFDLENAIITRIGKIKRPGIGAWKDCVIKAGNVRVRRSEERQKGNSLISTVWVQHKNQLTVIAAAQHQGTTRNQLERVRVVLRGWLIRLPRRNVGSFGAHRKYRRNDQGTLSILQSLNGRISRHSRIGVTQEDLSIAEDNIVITLRAGYDLIV